MTFSPTEVAVGRVLIIIYSADSGNSCTPVAGVESSLVAVQLSHLDTVFPGIEQVGSVDDTVTVKL